MRPGVVLAHRGGFCFTGNIYLGESEWQLKFNFFTLTVPGSTHAQVSRRHADRGANLASLHAHRARGDVPHFISVREADTEVLHSSLLVHHYAPFIALRIAVFYTSRPKGAEKERALFLFPTTDKYFGCVSFPLVLR